MLFTVAFAIRESIEIVSYYKKKFRIRTGNEEDKETVEIRITTLEQHDKVQHDEIRKILKCVEDINDRLVNKEIEDMRKTILDFCSELSSGKKFNKEAFDYIFKTHENYNDILKKYNKENNVINESMKFICNKYQELLNKGEL